ncbi:PqqD family peptide modification chaperone [uncultured Thermanaerothrix sp.]|uniref:radical SAM protein n=1 Tax=uncultured Thermanaerothrix sp. TaxID=1195149 RepID=UPI002620BAD8|nr:PqqD family peptide modification chaperone [uncultured Thermanaerothrix sp.]
MRQRFREWVEKLFLAPNKPLSPGMFHWQTPPDAPQPHRLHLRIEPDGQGLLILDASTVLHLNQTATEYAYHRILGTPAEEVAQQIAKRYRVSKSQALADYHAFLERLESLLNTPDLDPEIYLGLERYTPYQELLSAPLRLDCALTYRTEDESIRHVAPVDRVRRELVFEEWQQCLQKAWDAGIPHVIFTGGEPTLRPDLIDLIAFVESLGMVSGLLTSGLRLVEKDYLTRILASGLDHVMIVLDPLNEISWEAIRDTLAADLAITVHLTITPDNQNALMGLIERLSRMGVSRISLSATHPQLHSALQSTREYVARSGMHLVWDLPVPYSHLNPVALELSQALESPPQGAGIAWLYVEPDGDVLPYQGASKVLGNLLTDSWDVIWKRAKPH